MAPARSPTITAAMLATTGVAFVAALAALVAAGATAAFDTAIIDALRAPATEEVLSPLRAITELGSTSATIAAAAVTLLVGIAIGPWLHGVAGALTITLATIANSALKLAIARERPDLLEPLVDERGFSFPSGHAMLGLAAYGVLAVLIGRSRLPRAARISIIVALGMLVGLIGISRVWLGVHFPTDVLAGWAAGGVVVVLYALVTRRVSPEPAAAAVHEDPAGPRSDRPGPG